jgi:DNA-binding response OmpR family regulator
MLIAVTGQYPKDGDRILGELGGYDHYFIKPFDTKVLLQLVASGLAKRRD